MRETILKIEKNERLLDALKRDGKEMLPTRCIINKTLTGIGATYCELTSNRDSIIVEPNVPVIEGKVKKHKNQVLGVYAGITGQDIERYLQKHKTRRKIIVTPESFQRMKETLQELGIDIYNEFFLLFDECEKLVQDIDYRETIELPMKDFFLFRNKAMVSATPLIASDPRFEEQGFTMLRIVPNFIYHKKIKLIVTNNILESFLEEAEKSPANICVFCNSIDTFESIFCELPFEMQKQVTTFCSENSMDKLTYIHSKNFKRKASSFIGKLSRINFFTSRFYSAVDIEPSRPPHVIILSDMQGAPQSAIDPATEAIQIVGRFRNGVKSITHISSIKEDLEYYTEGASQLYLEGSLRAIETIRNLYNRAMSEGEKGTYLQALLGISENQYLNEDGTRNEYKIANFYNDQRVKGLYTDANKLLAAYQAVPSFKVDFQPRNYLFSDNDRLARQRAKTRKWRAELLLRQLEKISHLRFTDDPRKKEFYERQTSRLLHTPFDNTLFDCYRLKGADYLRSINFRESEMLRSLKRKSVQQLKKCPAVTHGIHKLLETGKEYTVTEVSTVLTNVYKKNGIPVNKRVSATEIDNYFETSSKRNRKERSILIVNRKQTIYKSCRKIKREA
ncbi:hypothetical protein [Bacteroides sedimenti]